MTRLEWRTGSSYPGGAALGVLDEPETTEAVAASIASELAAAGVNWNLAPVADVNVPENPVIGCPRLRHGSRRSSPATSRPTSAGRSHATSPLAPSTSPGTARPAGLASRAADRQRRRRGRPRAVPRRDRSRRPDDHDGACPRARARRRAGDVQPRDHRGPAARRARLRRARARRRTRDEGGQRDRRDRGIGRARARRPASMRSSWGTTSARTTCAASGMRSSRGCRRSGFARRPPGCGAWRTGRSGAAGTADRTVGADAARRALLRVGDTRFERAPTHRRAASAREHRRGRARALAGRADRSRRRPGPGSRRVRRARRAPPPLDAGGGRRRRRCRHRGRAAGVATRAGARIRRRRSAPAGPRSMQRPSSSARRCPHDHASRGASWPSSPRRWPVCSTASGREPRRSRRSFAARTSTTS